MSELIREALDRAAAVVRTCNDPAQGMTELLAFCRQRQPRSKKLWDSISEINFATDALRMRSALAKVLDEARLGPEYTGFYFGLDGDNNANGKGIEFSCSKAHKPGGRDVEFAYEGESLPDIPSAAITQLYQHIEVASFADHCICLGYLGLALRSVFESLSTTTTVGEAPERAICCGFHEGNLMLLGIVRATSFEIMATFPPPPEKRPADIELLPDTLAGKFFLVEVAGAGLDCDFFTNLDQFHRLQRRIHGKMDSDPAPVLLKGGRTELENFDVTHTIGVELAANERAASWFRKNDFPSIQLIDAVHPDRPDRFVIVNLLRSPPCLNLDKSEYSPGLADPTSIGYVQRVVIDGDQVPPNLVLFRLAEKFNMFIATARFRELWKASGLRGLRFDPVLST